jgi:regulatory protein
MKMMQKNRKKPNKTALVQAVDLLARQAHSTQKLIMKLKLRGYEEEEIQAAIERLTQRGYLNDEMVCARQFEYLFVESRYSVKQICIKLMQRGFASGLVHQCVPQEYEVREEQMALRCLKLKFKSRTADPQKMMQYLYIKGFESSTLHRAVDAFEEECEAEE